MSSPSGTKISTANPHPSTHHVRSLNLFLHAYPRVGTVALTKKNSNLKTAHGKGSGAWASAYTSARALVSQMTLDEKVNITIGHNTSAENACHGSTGSVPRLGWPGLCLQDAGNGVRGADLTNSYPSGIHVGAAWDKNLTYRRGLAMGNEFRIKGGERLGGCGRATMLLLRNVAVCGGLG